MSSCTLHFKNISFPIGPQKGDTCFPCLIITSDNKCLGFSNFDDIFSDWWITRNGLDSDKQNATDWLHDMWTYCHEGELDIHASRLKNVVMILCTISTCLIYTLDYLQQPGEQALYPFQVKHFLKTDLTSKFEL